MAYENLLFEKKDGHRLDHLQPAEGAERA